MHRPASPALCGEVIEDHRGFLVTGLALGSMKGLILVGKNRASMSSFGLYVLTWAHTPAHTSVHMPHTQIYTANISLRLSSHVPGDRSASGHVLCLSLLQRPV